MDLWHPPPRTLIHTPYIERRGRLVLFHTGTCSAEGERSAHLSSLKSRCDSKFFSPCEMGDLVIAVRMGVRAVAA